MTDQSPARRRRPRPRWSSGNPTIATSGGGLGRRRAVGRATTAPSRSPRSRASGCCSSGSTTDLRGVGATAWAPPAGSAPSPRPAALGHRAAAAATCWSPPATARRPDRGRVSLSTDADQRAGGPGALRPQSEPARAGQHHREPQRPARAPAARAPRAGAAYTSGSPAPAATTQTSSSSATAHHGRDAARWRRTGRRRHASPTIPANGHGATSRGRATRSALRGGPQSSSSVVVPLRVVVPLLVALLDLLERAGGLRRRWRRGRAGPVAAAVVALDRVVVQAEPVLRVAHAARNYTRRRASPSPLRRSRRVAPSPPPSPAPSTSTGRRPRRSTGSEVKDAETIERMRVAGRLAAQARELVGSHVAPGRHHRRARPDRPRVPLRPRRLPLDARLPRLPQVAVLERQRGDLPRHPRRPGRRGRRHRQHRHHRLPRRRARRHQRDLPRRRRRRGVAAARRAHPARPSTGRSRRCSPAAGSTSSAGSSRPTPRASATASSASSPATASARRSTPAWSCPHYDDPRLRRRDPRSGMTFTIEPMLNLGTHEWEMWDDGWTVVTRDGRRSAQFEHTLLVTADRRRGAHPAVADAGVHATPSHAAPRVRPWTRLFEGYPGGTGAGVRRDVRRRRRCARRTDRLRASLDTMTDARAGRPGGGAAGQLPRPGRHLRHRRRGAGVPARHPAAGHRAWTPGRRSSAASSSGSGRSRRSSPTCTTPGRSSPTA